MEKAMQLEQHQWNLKTPTSFRIFYLILFYFGSYMRWMYVFYNPKYQTKKANINNHNSNNSNKRQRT